MLLITATVGEPCCAPHYSEFYLHNSLISLCFEAVSVLQSSCKYRRRPFLTEPFKSMPSPWDWPHSNTWGIPYEHKGIFLHNHSTALQLRRLTFRYCHGIYRPHSDFISFPNNDFYSKRSQFDEFSGPTAVQSVWNSFSVFLSLHDLGTFEDYRVFCRLSLSLRLWCFLIRFRSSIFDRDSTEVMSSFFLHPVIICRMAGNV